MTRSHYRHTLNGVVLLDFDDLMLAEPVYPITGEFQQRQFVGRKWGGAKSLQNAVRAYSWTRVIKFNSIEERETRQLQLAASFLNRREGELLIEVQNGGSTLVKEFCLNSVIPSQRFESNAFDLLLTFEGIGGEEVTVSDGGFGDRWDPTDSSTWDAADSSTWKLI